MPYCQYIELKETKNSYFYWRIFLIGGCHIAGFLCVKCFFLVHFHIFFQSMFFFSSFVLWVKKGWFRMVNKEKKCEKYIRLYCLVFVISVWGLVLQSITSIRNATVRFAKNRQRTLSFVWIACQFDRRLSNSSFLKRLEDSSWATRSCEK